MERNDVPLGLALKQDFEATVVFEYVEGSSILLVGPTPPDMAMEMARAGYNITVCSNDVQYMNAIAAGSRRDNIKITFIDFETPRLTNIRESELLFDAVICLPTYTYAERDDHPLVLDLLKVTKPGGMVIWNFNSSDIARSKYVSPKPELGYTTPSTWTYNTFGYLDTDFDEEDAEYRLWYSLFSAEESRHLWTYLQLRNYVTADGSCSHICLSRKAQDETSDNTSEGELEEVTAKESPEDGHMGDVPVCC